MNGYEIFAEYWRAPDGHEWFYAVRRRDGSLVFRAVTLEAAEELHERLYLMARAA